MVPLLQTTPVAASTVLAPVLDGAPLVLRVTATGRYAAYLTGAGDELVVVAARDAVVPPCAVTLPDGHRPDALLPAGTVVQAADGCLTWPAHRLTVSRWWSPATVAVTRPCGRRAGSDAGTRRRLRARLAATQVADPAARRARAVGALAATAIADGDVPRATRLLCGVLGLGPGLTPSGDDVAAGVLLMSRALASPALLAELEPLWRSVAAAARHRTTTVSAALLAEAAQGRAAAPVARAVHVLAGAPATAASAHQAFAHLLDIGHHSGADLAAGMLATADALSLANQTAGHRRSA